MTPLRRALLAVATVGVLTASACGSEPAQNTPAPSSPASTTTTTSPPTTSSPAAEGAEPQVAGVIATGLAVPWGLDFLPGGAAIVTERDSRRLLQISPAGQVRTLGVINEAAPEGEGGLLGVAASPTFTRDRLIYLYLTTATDNRVVRGRLAGGQIGALQVVLDGIPRAANHDGGRLAFGPDGMLYVATGDAGDQPAAQDPASLAGKILRMTPDGAVPPDNPTDTLVYSLGHRNVQGLAWAENGTMFASEFGWDEADELNRIEAGGNYGWPEVEGTGGEPEFIDPQLTWPTDDASPSGLAATTSHLWMAGLGGERLWRMDLAASDDQASNPTAFFLGQFGRLRTVAVAPDGSLWVTTSNRDGRGSPTDEDDQILRVTLSP